MISSTSSSLPDTLLESPLAVQTLGIIVLVLLYVLWKKYVRPDEKREGSKSILIQKGYHNPIHEGRFHLDWECEGVFNPGAIRIGDTTHLLYRAIGKDGVSRLGYASSKDGVRIDGTLPYPVYSSIIDRFIPPYLRAYNPTLYPSGGSWGGCEDPRITKIDDTIYLTYSAFDGWDFIRIGLTSISEKDFLEKKWTWKRPQLISPPGEIHKNWVLFPEKIQGKYGILHSISPKIEIELRENLEGFGFSQPFVQSPVGPRESTTDATWDTRMRGPGAPPLKTEKGWLLFYHANTHAEPHKYKVGVLLLDLQEPYRVLARLQFPLLEPNEWYENDGKPGIVYVCGAVKQGDRIFLYYGGGDKRVCVAHLEEKELLHELLTKTG